MVEYLALELLIVIVLLALLLLEPFVLVVPQEVPLHSFQFLASSWALEVHFLNPFAFEVRQQQVLRSVVLDFELEILKGLK